MKQLKHSPVIRLARKDQGQFSAYQARHQAFGGLMNPVIGFDYYWLTADVFGPHRHEGMSAVSGVVHHEFPIVKDKPVRERWPIPVRHPSR